MQAGADLGHAHASTKAAVEDMHALVLQIVEAGGAPHGQRIYRAILIHLHTPRILQDASHLCL